MSYVQVTLTPDESRVWDNHLLGLYIGYVTTDRRDSTTGHWYRVLETSKCPMEFPSVVAVDPTLLGNVLSVWSATLKKEARRKGWTEGEKLSLYVSETVANLFQKLLNAKTNIPMIDLKNITLEQLEELKKQVAAKEVEMKKVTDLSHTFETASKKAGFETLEAALTAIGYVKATEVKTAKTKSTKPAGERKARVTVTEEMRATVKEMVAAGKTIEEIAAEIGTAVGTAASIKKKLGLTKPKKAAA